MQKLEIYTCNSMRQMIQCYCNDMKLILRKDGWLK
nr:MAG TPA: hypothetical protein [Caudoviricetes sp.]